MRIPEAVLVDLLSAARIALESDGLFWYAVDLGNAETLAQGADASRVAREALTALRRRLDLAEGGELRRAVGDDTPRA
jgi:hypothetical protein